MADAPWRVPFAETHLTDADIAAVEAALRSGWLTIGPRTQAFERAFADYTGARHAVTVSSCTAALHLLCRAARIGPGDEVIVPSMTFVATANVVVYTGATPVFADCAAADRPWLDPDACEALITPRTRAILTVDYGGHPGELEALGELADARGLILLEDAAHAAGSRLDGRHLGTFGRAGAFSLYANKNLSAGEGGVLITDDDDWAAFARSARSQGLTASAWDREARGDSRYDVDVLGFSYRIDDARSALAAERLKRLDADNERRRALCERYREALADAPFLEVAPDQPPGACHHLFTVLLAEGVDRARFRNELGERGVQTSVHFPPVHRLTLYRDGAPDLPNAEAWGERTVSLPLFAHMTFDQQDEAIAAVIDASARA